MYISNPLMKANDRGASLMSTHPPLQERIRILKAMAGAVSYQEYDRAYRNVTEKNAVLPPSALGSTEQFAPRPPSQEGPDTPRERMHQAGDALRHANAFQFLTCPCGLRVKVPPDYAADTVQCPRCHTQLNVPRTG
jgi:heat shock protein HtpX